LRACVAIGSVSRAHSIIGVLPRLSGGKEIEVRDFAQQQGAPPAASVVSPAASVVSPAASVVSYGSLPAMELFVRWHHVGDRDARAELVTRYLPLARRLARRYAGAGEPLEDLVQVASLGLVKAVDRYRTERGVAFGSYAVPTILGELRRHFRDRGWSVHVPRRAKEMALQAGRAREEIAGTLGRSPTVAELAQYLEWSLEEVLCALEAAAAHHAASLDAPAGEGDEPASGLLEHLGCEDERYGVVDERLGIERATERLPATDRTVLRLRFEEGLTQSEIASRLGVSQMQVSRILRRALAYLRERVRAPER
jgi:RNA polymerase sigma-B factor